MAQLSKNALTSENNNSFPNNNTGYITPELLRSFNQDMIDSTVNQLEYDAEIAVIQAEIQSLEAFTASLSGGFVTQGEFQTATASLINSINTKLDTASFNAFTASVSGVATGSLLVTASATSNVITFTKGDASTFDITVADTTNLSSLNAFTQSANSRLNNLESTTASINSSITQLNVSTASQEVSINALNAATGSYVTETESGSFLVTASVNLNTITFTKGNGTTFNLTVNTGSGGGGGTIPEGTISSSAQITALGFVSSSITGSSIITASVSGDDITFTKGDGSQFTLQVATGAFAETASFAESATDIVVTVKNTSGAQLDKGTIVRIIGATGDNPLIATASWEDDNNSANTLGWLETDIPNDDFGRVITQGVLLGVDTDPALGYTAGQILYLSSSGQYTNVVPPAPYHEVRLGQVLRAQQNNGSVYVLIQNGYELSELHDVNITTGSLANNDLLAYNSVSTQWENKTLTQVGAATTGSNTFRGVQTLLDSGSNQSILAPFSGGFALVAKGLETTIANVTSSQVATAATGNVNLAFKTQNSATPITVSGSGNIFILSGATTDGFRRQMTSFNVFNSVNTPNLTSSMAFPVIISNNIGPMTITMRGPVSASQWSVSSNVGAGTLNLGGLSATFHATNHLGGIQASSNTLNGTINFIANQSLINGTSTISNNDYKGGGRLAASSSAITFSRNTVAGNNNQFHNQYFSGSLGTGSVTFQDLIVYGDQNQVYFVGSAPTVQAAPSFISSTILGYENRVTIDGGASKYMAATHLLGNGLIVSASTPIANTNGMGSLFAGRWNANDSIRNNSGEEIFVVGTGTSTSARKTGFLIDSGSNTFVEGTFNVSGSTSLNGQLVVTGSLTASLQEGYAWVGNGAGITYAVATSSFGGGSPIDLSSLNAFTASQEALNLTFATTGSNSFTGDQYISGAVYVSGAAAAIDLDTVNGFISLYNYDEGTSVSTNISSATASLSLTAFGDQASIEDGGTKWWYATNDGQGNYSSLHSERDIVITGSFTASLQEGYVWVGDGNGVSTTVATSSFGGGGGVSFPYSGSVEITGSVKVQPITLSVASNTASINMQDSNFFILNLPTASTTHISFTNITPGESINLLVSQSASASTGSVSFAPNILFANGTEYQATSTGSAKDIVSFISFNRAEVFATQIKNLL